jgi:hypothetical protein
MRLEPLYVVRFRYPESWAIALGPGGAEGQHFFVAEGHCDGRLPLAPRRLDGAGDRVGGARAGSAGRPDASAGRVEQVAGVRAAFRRARAERQVC